MSESNKVVLKGVLRGKPEFSHGFGAVKFYSAFVGVLRSSGVEDVVPVLFPDRLADYLSDGMGISLEGTLRSYNNKSGQGRRLILNILVDSWESYDTVAEDNGWRNDVTLSCRLCRAPVLRTTPKGRVICDLLAAVGRPSGGSDYLPVIAWGRSAEAAGRMEVGTAFTCAGRFQSREYVKRFEDGTSETMTAYEVSAREIGMA